MYVNLSRHAYGIRYVQAYVCLWLHVYRPVIVVHLRFWIFFQHQQQLHMCNIYSLYKIYNICDITYISDIVTHCSCNLDVYEVRIACWSCRFQHTYLMLASWSLLYLWYSDLNFFSELSSAMVIPASSMSSKIDLSRSMNSTWLILHALITAQIYPLSCWLFTILIWNKH